jgi:predicted PurR-regulated permease PerM
MPKLFNRNSGPQEVDLTISARTFFKLVALVIVTIFLLAAFKIAAHALLLLFIAFFLALALNAPVSFVARHLPGPLRGRRALATSLSTLLVIVLIGGFLYLIVPPIVHQVNSLIDRAPQLVQDLRDKNSDVNKLVNRYNLQGQVNDFSQELSGRLHSITSRAVSTVTSIASGLVAVLTVLVLTFMMLVEGPHWVEVSRRILPRHKRDWADKLTRDMYRVVKGFVNGQVIIALIAAIVIFPALLIFHVKYPVALIPVVFICDLIPLVGAIIGAIIVTFIALFTSPLSALGILIYYILYQQVENYLIQPRLQANTTNMSPLLVFTSVVVGVSFGGLFGGLIAIPAAGCLRVVVIDLLRSRNMIDSEPADTSKIKA